MTRSVILVGMGFLCVLALMISCGDPAENGGLSASSASSPATGARADGPPDGTSKDGGDGPPFTAGGAKFPDDVLVDAAFAASADGLDYSVQVGEKTLGEGHLNEGDTGTVDLYGILAVTFTVTEIWTYDVEIEYFLTGLVEEAGYFDFPFGQYAFYWGQDGGRVPQDHSFDVQAWFAFETDRVTYHGEGNIEDYPFAGSGTITEEGQVGEVEMPYDYLVALTFWGIGQPRKTVDALVTDEYDGSVWWQGTIGDLPSAVMVLTINFDAM